MLFSAGKEIIEMWISHCCTKYTKLSKPNVSVGIRFPPFQAKFGKRFKIKKMSTASWHLHSLKPRPFFPLSLLEMLFAIGSKHLKNYLLEVFARKYGNLLWNSEKSGVKQKLIFLTTQYVKFVFCNKIRNIPNIWNV